ncbi:helix-turn-helix domain-containing protein [Gordonibacter sp. An230]|uniref:helix-turn-helix domain-containing protein n=1 Tax=Gordonibacter sp. An230 TaxID=1965592 RepID=UPI0023B8DB4E|nr:helix-turn-helix transcriptional regulator [Gordonibacter sp. An230]
MGKRPATPAAGFALYWLTEILSFHAATAFADLGSMGAKLENVYFATLAAARIVAYAIVVLARGRSHEEGLPPVPAAAGATAAALSGLALVAGAITHTNAGATDPTALATFVTGAATLGAAQGVMGLAWASKLPLLSYRGSYLYLIATHVAATALVAVALLLPTSWLLPLTAVSLVTANACFAKLPRAERLEHTVREQAGDIAPLLWRGVLAVGVFAFVSGLVSSIARQGFDDANPVEFQFFTQGVSSVVLVVMAVPALVFHQPLKLETSYRVALPLSALGFLVLPGLIETVPPGLSGTLVTTGYMITGIVLYCMVGEASKIARVPALPLVAGVSCLTLICLLAGEAAGLALARHLVETGTSAAFMGLGGLYLVALAASWLVGRSDARKQSCAPLPTNVHRDSVRHGEKGGPGEHCDAERASAEGTDPSLSLEELAARYRLSDQESTVLALFMEGRTIPRIAQELYLSQSAVKYHAQKLYRRFGVHSRSELCGAVAQLRRERSERPFPENDLGSTYDLTAREREVLAGLSRGLSVTEIADDLDISENTVKTHVKRIYGKLGVHSKQEVIDLVQGSRPTA